MISPKRGNFIEFGQGCSQDEILEEFRKEKNDKYNKSNLVRHMRNLASEVGIDFPKGTPGRKKKDKTADCSSL